MELLRSRAGSVPAAAGAAEKREGMPQPLEDVSRIFEKLESL